ncbi:MAG: PQQ-dependent sugar dehydrogenase [Gemmatimonadetes bacterium]|nr:PQQ-dependent sugar dehydrogenase [Gemmatimonadota bacterium]
MRVLVGVAAAGVAAAMSVGALETDAAQQGRAMPAAVAAPMPNPVAAYHGKLLVPAGLKVDDYARVPGARLMALGPDGSVYVSQTGAGTVVRLVDANGDGVAERSAVVAEGLHLPHGLAVHGGWLYVANTDEVVRIKLNAAGVAEGTPQPTAARYDAAGGHFTRTVVFGPDDAMYVAVGSTCNICVEKDSTRAAVLRFDAEGHHGIVFARGLRNAVGLAIHAPTGALWVSQHERDNLLPSHEDLPPEELNILREGGDYGWPYCFGDRVPNPEFNDAARCASTLPPALAMQAHSAPLGLAFLAGATQLPADYRGDALLAFHGSWNRRVPTGAKVVRIRIRGGRPVGYEDFLTGFQEGDGRRWGRPVDVLVLKDGSVLVSDDDAGMIYRVHR